MDKLDGKTSDIIKDNIQKLKELFPEILTENKINFDLLRQYLGDEVEANDKFYSFDWYGKEKAIQMAISQSNATLRPDKDSSKDWDNTKNLFIEGDNLEVMRILRQTYREKVKMIYIDPPYNTGKDFVYTDNFTDNVKNYKEKTNTQAQVNPETGGRYHTNWLNMMYPRLRLAKDLLREDGVIFISIDDNEVHNLRKICDEIFGEENVEMMVWDKIVNQLNAGSGKMKITHRFRRDHEYLLVVYKKKEEIRFNKPLKIFNYKNNYTNKDNDIRGNWLDTELCKSEEKSIKKGKNYYSITLPDGTQISRQWHISKEEFDALDEDNRIYWGSGSSIPRKKIFLSEPRPITPTSVLREQGGTTDGVEEMGLLLGYYIFDNPKSTKLISYLIEISSSKNSIILDFFAGSGTTAHAVMQLNAEDGGNRKFIMVQLDEETDEKSEAYKAGYKTIAELSRERIRRAGEKIVADYADKLAERESPLDIGFKAFYLDNTNMSKWDPKVSVEDLPMALSTIANTPIKSDRSEEDVLYEILLKYGIDITLPIVEHTISGVPVYTMGGNIMVICLSHQLTEDIVQGIADLEPEHIVVYDNAFPQDADKLNAENIWNSLESKPKIKTI
jgi:adenine-specific DNA-methyltransferase